MNKAKPKPASLKPKVSPKPSRDAPRKNEIPDKILNPFLDREIGLSELDDISLVRAAFLWETGGIERYRINVWRKSYHEDRICPKVQIIHSFFVHYYPEEQRIANKTTPSKKSQNLFRKN